MKKILFVVATNAASEIENRYMPLGLMYLSASLKRHFGESMFQIKMISSDFEKTFFDYKPDLVGISSVSQNYGLAKKYARLSRQSGVPAILGGVHISIMPQSLSEDFVLGCIGEGENTIIEIMKVFLDLDGSFPTSRLSAIKGIIFWHNGTLEYSEPGWTEKELDNIPHPDRSLEGPVKHGYIFSSRGCPYRCSFCSSSRYWQNLRYFSAEYVVEEIEELVNAYGTRMISFYDDLFVGNTNRLKKIADLVVARGLNRTVQFTCSARANTIVQDVIEQLKRMNVVSVGMGLESGNPRVLHYLKGRSVTVEDNFKAVELLHSAGIMANASFVIGSPDETKDEMLDTYNFIRRSKLSFVDIYVLTPYPGTPIWEYALSKGFVSNEMDWGRLNVNFEVSGKNAIILSEKLDRYELIKMYKKFRRIRLIRNTLSLWNHPMKIDFIKVSTGMLKEKLSKWLARVF